MHSQNNFGALAQEYDASRRGYGEEVYAYLRTLAGEGVRNVLDMGCGTGISTRELHGHGFVVTGMDKDETMIGIARAKSDPAIPYIIATTDKLPFDDGQFNIVTAFTSFHWFTDDASVNEIRRVLSPGGLFFAVLKKRRPNHSEEFDRQWRDIISKYAGPEHNKAAEQYAPVSVLERHGFTDIRGKSFVLREEYSLKDALTLLKSMSLWNLVPEGEQEAFLSEVESLYADHLVDSRVVFDQDVLITAGYR